MANYLNPISRIQKWMDTMAGQTFMNYAYSWGAAVVILGTLFKLLHLSGANIMLALGMGTEVFVFLVSGFERVTERVPDELSAEDKTEEPIYGDNQDMATVHLASVGQVASQAQQALSYLQKSNHNADGELLEATNPIEVEQAVRDYAQELKELTQVLSRVREQAEHMSTDSEEMENLNRTLTGIATVYELQLRNISKQVSTIEQIDEQTRHMAKQIEELNNVYARMIKALTVNMQGGAETAPKQD